MFKKIANHTLAIEIRRWKKVERNSHLYQWCSAYEVEGESNFIFECARYSIDRSEIFRCIKSKA